MDNSTAADRLSENWLHAGRVLQSVTHDVNNRLGAILAYAELIALAPGNTGGIANMAQEIASAVRDSAAQLDTAATLISKDLSTIETIHLNELLPRVSSLFHFELDRAGSGLDLELPAEVCAFAGVRTRLVRALTHAVRHAADTMAAAPNPSRLRVRLNKISKGFAIEIQGHSGLDEFPASLAEAREHIQYHRGKLTCVPPGLVRIEVPQDTGLIKIDANL